MGRRAIAVLLVVALALFDASSLALAKDRADYPS